MLGGRARRVFEYAMGFKHGRALEEVEWFRLQDLQVEGIMCAMVVV